MEQRLQLVEELWDSIAAEHENLGVSEAQRAELDERLAAYESDGDDGRPAFEVINEIRSRL